MASSGQVPMGGERQVESGAGPEHHLVIASAWLTRGAGGLEAVPAEDGQNGKLKKGVKKVGKSAEDANDVVDTVDDAQRTNGRSLLGAAASSRTVATATGGAGRAAGCGGDGAACRLYTSPSPRDS